MGESLASLQNDVILHVEFGFARRYDIYVGEDVALFAKKMQTQTADKMGVTADRVTDVQIYKGTS